jgi:hypothetical protein
MKKIFLALVMLLSLGSTLWIEKVSAKTVTFIIQNVNDWKKFRNEVINAKGQYWVDARLEADITTDLGIGINPDAPYRGTFDGNGHTLTVDIKRGDGKSSALFCYSGDVTIRDLHLKGKITGGIHSAGLIGQCIAGTSAVTIDRVWISTDVSTNESYAGGIIGHSNEATLVLNDCRFDGSITTNNKNEGSYIGCIVGWCNGGSWTFHRVYNASENSKFTAWRIWFCADSSSGSAKVWGSNSKSSNTITSTTWGDWGVTAYNKSDQNEVVNLMNAEQPGSWGFVEGKAVPMMGEAYAVPNWQLLSGNSSYGRQLSSGHYYITKDIVCNNYHDGGSGLSIAPGATVHIYIPKGVTLKATGSDADGKKGAGAGILLPYGSTLYLEGGGTVEAKGGNAANGSDGQNGGDAGYSSNKGYAGGGGNGGDGGGGAGAGIGTSGGYGGAGGNGPGGYYHNNNKNGTAGGAGGTGGTASEMGTLYVDQASGLKVNATGGKAATRNGSGGSGGKSRIEHRGEVYDVFSMAGGGGGGGGGYGGAASQIGTGGPGGGGGGGGSNGAMGSKYTGYYSEYANGGIGGQNADGNYASNGGNAGADTDYYSSNKCSSNKSSSWVYSSCHHDGGGSRGAAGGSGGRGDGSHSRPTDYNFLVNYKVMDHFGGSVKQTISRGYKSSANPANITVCIPTHYALGVIQQDKYLEQWNTRSDGKGSSHAAGHSYRLSRGTTNLYAEWNDYKDIFPEGYGSKSKPFIIKDAQLLSLADYVNSGCNTRDVYFKQQNDIIVSNILSNHNRGSQWTPIGHACVFEGDYDGGGYLIRNGEIGSKVDNKDLSAAGIFGKVMGSVHNLGVEALTINASDNDYARCGLIAGMLVSEKIEQRAGQIRDCYAANNKVKVNYGSCMVGEMAGGTSMSHCLETSNVLSGAHAGSFSSIIQDKATVDMCFTSGGGIAPIHYGRTTNCQTSISADDMKSGKITWLLNDNSAFATTWYQNVDKGVHDAHPMLTTASNRVFHEGDKYSNEMIGGLSLSGKGLKDDPYLVKDKEDLEKLATFCNSNNNTAGMYFLQTADIDLKGGGLTPIGNPGSFAGFYDGDGHTIRNGKIETIGPLGVFGYVTGTVTRLCVENTTVKGTNGGARAGAIAGRVRDNGEISYCFVKDCDVSVKDGVWGVAGPVVGDIINQGGVKNCLAFQNKVKASDNWYGYLCGATENDAIIDWCYTDGSTLVGPNQSGSVTNSSPGLSKATLENGSVTYKLNGGFDNPEPAWFQNIARGSVKDQTPVLSSDHAVVYRVEGNYTNDGEQLGKLGKGTETDPYKIGTPADLKKLIISVGSMKRSNFYVRQTADIDMADSLVVPIGTCTAGFEGHYDGGGYVIKNLTMRSYKDESMGLFNNIIGTVENLGIENGTFTAEGSVNRVGALAGKLSREGVVRNCYVKNSKIDFHHTSGVVVGALVGEQTDSSRIEACYGYKNKVIGQDDGQRHYGHVLGYMGSKATASLLFTDGATLCADKQEGAKNITSSETEVSESRFNSGEVCYLLNGAKDNGKAWHQTFRTDNTPVTKASHLPVYRHTLDYQTLYTNSNDVPYTVWLTLAPNYGKAEGESMEVFKGDENLYVPGFKLKSHAVNRPDYDLVGWNTQADGKGKFYPYDGEVVPTDRLTLYAVWGLKVPSQKTATTLVATLEKDGVYAVYDGAGGRSPYGYNYNGKITLKAPDKHILCLTGTVSTEAADTDGKLHDYMIVYDGDETKTQKLANEKGVDTFYSQTNGEKEDIGKLLSSGIEMTIEFVSDDDKCFDGLDLQVAVLPNAIKELAGTGAKESPFQVISLEDLNAVNDYIRITGNSKIYIEQVDNIDLEGEDLTPLGSSVTRFEGHYDGGGYVISNGKIQSTEKNLTAGIFPVVTGTVTRLGVENMTVEGVNDNARIGAIAGRLNGSGSITNCYVKGCTVTSDVASVAGAIVADMFDQASIKNCFTYNNTLKASRTAHICSETKRDTEISRCYTDGNNLFSEAGAKVMNSDSNISAERFSSGELCYLLNDSKTDNVVWRQTLGTDNLPVFTDSHAVVYCYQRNDQDAYSNTAITQPQYYISSKEDFVKYIQKKGDIYLTQDINIDFHYNYNLSGNLDGGGHCISYYGSSICRGLFHRVYQGASIKHLIVMGATVDAQNCGGIAYSNAGTISDCSFFGNLSNFSRVEYSCIAGIVMNIQADGVIDHCSGTGILKQDKEGSVYPITKTTSQANYCTWVDLHDKSLYAAQRDSALNAQAEYPVYAKAILDVVGLEITVGNNTISVPDKHLTSLTINDGEHFSCLAEVEVDKITYKRKGTNGAYEPWVLPFDYTIDNAMRNEGAEFYRFEKDSLGNIVAKQIKSVETYQATANEPLIFRKSGQDEYNFQMKLVKDGGQQSLTIKMPIGGVAASMSSMKDVAQIKVTYDNIPGEKTDMMYLWNSDKKDFVLSDHKTGVTPFRYYLQYMDKNTKALEEYEQTDWARKQRKGAVQKSLPMKRATRRSDLSTLIAEGWKPIFLEPKDMPEVTAKMLDDFEILALSDIYDTEAAGTDTKRYAVTVIYEPVEEGTTLPYALPLLVRAKHANAEPLVTDQMGIEIEAALKRVEEEVGMEELMDFYDEMHYCCNTFNGRYDVWQMPVPERNSELSEYGALLFNNTGKTPYFSRIAADDNSIFLQPMSYFFTAYDNKTFENLPLTNDRIEIVTYGYTDQSETTGIEDVRGKMDDVRDKKDDVYNLNGQKVDDSYRGLVIKNGRKVVKR